MKKLLLLGSCLVFAASLQAQNNRIIKAPGLRENVLPKMRMDVSSNLTNTNRYYVRPAHASKNPSNNNVLTTSVTGKTQVGSSVNVFGDLLSEGNNLNADNNLGLVVRNHRANHYDVVVTATAASGDYNASFTTNYCGGTWDSTRITSAPASAALGINLRYPTGSIYNPPGNTTPNMAYVMGSGPFHIGGVWNGGYFTSGRLDGATVDYLDTIQSDAATTLFDNQMPRLGSSSTDDGAYHVLGSNFDWGTGMGTIFGVYAYKAAFDAGTSHWTHPVGTYLDLSSDNANDFGTIAFSQDGMIGYVAVPGVDPANACQSNVQPIIWKTTDAGVTWIRQPYFDFKNAYGMNTVLAGQPTLPLGNYIPYFSSTDGWDATVDKWGNLHLVTTVYGSSYDEVNCDGDSAGFIYPEQHIVDVYGNGTTWAACKVADLLTAFVPAANSPWINAGAGIALFGRIQIGRTQDGSRIFYGWVDSDPGIDPTNLYPDIHVAALNVDNYMFTPESNVTAGTAFAEQNFWLYLSNIILSNSGTYTIPMTTTESWDPNDPGGADVEHMAVCGVTMTDADFTQGPCPSPTAIAELNGQNGVMVSQNYPNPYNGMTSFDLTLAHPSTVSVEVTNYLGQIVYSVAERKYESGVHKVDLNVTPLNSGLYFYTVKIGSDRISKKMMIY